MITNFGAMLYHLHRKTFAVLLIASASSVCSQDLLTGYAAAFRGADNVFPLSVAADLEGNTFVAGYFRGTVDLDPGPDILSFSATGFQDEAFVVKLDTLGQLAWAFAFGNTGPDRANDVAITPEGDIVVAGHFEGAVDFDPGPGSLLLTAAPFQARAFILKLSATGELVWAAGLGNDTYAEDVVIDTEGAIYLSGHFFGVSDLDPGPGSFPVISSGNADGFAVKLNASGGLLRAGTIGGAGFDYPRSIALDGQGGLLLAGSFNGFVDFDPGPGTFTLNAPGGNRRDIWVCRWDTTFALDWARQFTTNNLTNTALSIAADPWGNVLTTGFFSGTVDFDPGPGTLTVLGDQDIFVHKMDPAGELLWVRTYGNAQLSGGEVIRCTQTGQVLMGGYCRGTIDFDPGPGTPIVSSPNNSAVLLTLDADGDFVDVLAFNGTGNAAISGMALDAVEDVRLCGGFRSTVDFGAGADEWPLTSAGEVDGFVLALGRCTVTDEPDVDVQGLLLSTAAPGPLFQWIDCNTGEAIPDATEASFEAPGDGSYAVAAGTLYCKPVSECAVVLGTGLPEPYPSIHLQVMPNPASDRVTLVLSTPAVNGELRLLDMQGRVLRQVGAINGTQLEMDLRDLPSGVILMELRHAGAVQYLRLVKY